MDRDRNRFELRTDLAVEERERFGNEAGALAGVKLRQWEKQEGDIKLTEVMILDESGAEAMKKPVGTYLTIQADCLTREDEGYHSQVSEELGRQIKRLLSRMTGKENPQVLVAGLGNAEVTPDSLGPEVTGNLKVTDRLKSIAPGVMAQTGMETAQILKGIIRETKPDAVVAIDALAARSLTRLGNTIQLTDTGIHPGSGVGNHRKGLTEESLGVPVLAVGVPTVVGAAAIVQDTMSAFTGVLLSHEATRKTGQWMKEMDGEEQYQLIRELLEPEFGALYVTPPDVDKTIGRISFTISEAIHRAVHEKQSGQSGPGHGGITAC